MTFQDDLGYIGVQQQPAKETSGMHCPKNIKTTYEKGYDSGIGALSTIRNDKNNRQMSSHFSILQEALNLKPRLSTDATDVEPVRVLLQETLHHMKYCISASQKDIEHSENAFKRMP
ncbi:hypothetical protein PGTUg99_034637 [Puccinia graminis f. sp. tritici]|uniref:Uncharacterized protein n=1 Tax=Puccinia graminis f. sp. tritici TaxID=56615 RepID=A0A5B0R974_PUCGR|nr:hypothetical protein PGTUg99_034637 [Puccinia graminis f. sp. tritici]